MADTDLFSPYNLGSLTLANRIAMAPLTRSRAAAGLVPSDLAADHYSQRAGAGLIITEATQVSEQAQGYQDTPGLYTPQQIIGWRSMLSMPGVDASSFSFGTSAVSAMLIFRTERPLSRHRPSGPKPRPL